MKIYIIFLYRKVKNYCCLRIQIWTLSPDLAFEFSIYLIRTLKPLPIAALSVIVICVPWVLIWLILIQNWTQR